MPATQALPMQEASKATDIALPLGTVATASVSVARHHSSM